MYGIEEKGHMEDLYPSLVFSERRLKRAMGDGPTSVSRHPKGAGADLCLLLPVAAEYSTVSAGLWAAKPGIQTGIKVAVLRFKTESERATRAEEQAESGNKEIKRKIKCVNEQVRKSGAQKAGCYQRCDPKSGKPCC